MRAVHVTRHQLAQVVSCFSLCEMSVPLGMRHDILFYRMLYRRASSRSTKRTYTVFHLHVLMCAMARQSNARLELASVRSGADPRTHCVWQLFAGVCHQGETAGLMQVAGFACASCAVCPLGSALFTSRGRRSICPTTTPSPRPNFMEAYSFPSDTFCAMLSLCTRTVQRCAAVQPAPFSVCSS